MMKSAFILCLVGLYAFSVHCQTIGYDSAECGNNGCTEGEGPVCYSEKCYQCNPTPGADTNGLCMCGANQYCSGDLNDDDNFGKCKGYEGSILGNRCDPLLTVGDVVKGRNDQLFCGKLIFDSDSNARAEWEGFCNRGKCEVCQESDSKCGGAYRCALGSYVYAPANIFSWSYLFINPVSFSTFWAWMWLYIFFPIAVVGIFACKKLGVC